MTTNVALAQEKAIIAGLGEVKVSNDPSVVLTCLGLGSCIAVCFHDSIARIGGIAHVVLPSSEGKPVKLSAKYADVAIPLLIEEMKKLGALKMRLRVKLVGGAEMSKAAGMDNSFKIGERNQSAVKGALVSENINIVAEEIGGNVGRTARLMVGSGLVTVTSAGFPPIEL